MLPGCESPSSAVSTYSPPRSVNVGFRVRCDSDDAHQGNPSALPLIVTRPGPGRPATLLTEDDPVGPMQKTAPSVGLETSPTGGSSMPSAMSVLVPFFPEKPPVRKHERLALLQVSAPPPQSASVTQPRCPCPD